MNKYILNSIGIFLLALVAMATWATWEWGGVGQRSKAIVSEAAPVVQKMDTTISKADETIVLADKLINESRSLVVHTDLVARHEQQQMSTWDGHGQVLFDNLNGGVVDLRSTIQTATGLIQDTQTQMNTIGGDAHRALVNLPQTENRLDDNLDMLHKSIYDFDKLVSSPDITQTLHNTNTVTYNLGKTTGDFQTKFHSYLFPAPCSGTICALKKTWNGVSMGTRLIEPAVWGSELYHNTH